MARVWRVTLDEFSDHLRLFVDRAARDNDTVVIEAGGESVVTLQGVKHRTSARRPKSDADLKDLMDTAGSWADVDIDQFLADIYASRQSSRPPVDL